MRFPSLAKPPKKSKYDLFGMSGEMCRSRRGKTPQGNSYRAVRKIHHGVIEKATVVIWSSDFKEPEEVSKTTGSGRHYKKGVLRLRFKNAVLRK